MTKAVFHVVDSLRIGGAERMAVDLANGLSQRGWQVHLVATRESGPLEAQVLPNVNLELLRRRTRFDLPGLRRFRGLVREHRPALVHAHGWTTLQFCTAAILGVRRPPSLVFHDHRPAGLDPMSPSYRATAWVSTVAHVAVDHALLEPPLRTRRSSKRAVVPNGTPIDRFRRKSEYCIEVPPRLVAVANLRPQKDHATLLRALNRLKTAGTRFEVDLVGATPDRTYEQECRSLLRQLGLEDTVRIAGPSNDLGSRLATYDVGLLSSATESGPVALIEYLFAGLPFVVSDVGEVPALLPPTLRRWVVPPGDPAALAKRVQELLALSPDSRSELASIGLAFAQDHLSIERTIDSLEEVYDHITPPQRA